MEPQNIRRNRVCGCENDELSIQADNTRQMVEFARSKAVITDVIYIPIIFHICFDVSPVYNGQPAGDITKNVVIQKNIEYCVDLLNKDYQKKGTNFEHGKEKYKGTQFETLYNDYVSRASSTLFRFYHKDTKHVPFPKQSGDIAAMNSTIKTASPVIDPRHNLNVWIVDINSGLLGFGQFSWVSKYLPTTDGIIIAKGAWGINPEYGPSFKLNKTLTHEVGHYLGLYHIFQQTFTGQPGVLNPTDISNVGITDTSAFQNTGDLISDTPPQLNSGYGDPSEKPLDWPSSVVNGGEKSYHQWMNFMDYCDDDATFMFTKDQVYKMHIATQLWRPEMLENRDSTPNPDSVPDPEPEEPTTNPTNPTTPTNPTNPTIPTNPTTPTNPTNTPTNPTTPTNPDPVNIEKVIRFTSGWKLSGDSTYKNFGGVVLKTKNKGSGSMSIALPAGNYQFTLNANVKNPKTYVTVDGLTIKVPLSDNYQSITFEFKNKKDSISIIVGTTSSDKTTLFESVTIRNY